MSVEIVAIMLETATDTNVADGAGLVADLGAAPVTAVVVHAVRLGPGAVLVTAPGLALRRTSEAVLAVTTAILGQDLAAARPLNKTAAPADKIRSIYYEYVDLFYNYE